MRMPMSNSVVLLLLVSAVVVAVADRSTCKADITQIVINTDAYVQNGDLTTTKYVQNFSLRGTDITGVWVSWSGGGPLTFTTDGDGAWHYDSTAYATLDALHSVYSQGNYQFTIQKSGAIEDTVSLLFDANQPNGFVPVTFPLQNQIVPSSPAPTFTWNPVSSADGVALGCQLELYTGEKLYETIPYDLVNTSWTPSVGSLLSDTQYTFNLDLYQLGSASQGQFTILSDAFTYYGVFAHTNEIDFRTATTPEPSALVLMLSGMAAMFFWRRARPNSVGHALRA